MTARKAKADLHLVGDQDEGPRDIYAADRARIAGTDWAAVHVRSDRSKPVDLPDGPRRPFGLGGW